MWRSQPGLPLVTAVRADLGYTSGLAHHSDHSAALALTSRARVEPRPAPPQ